MLHTLLLNATYECMRFIPERNVFKLLAKGKIEVLESWDEKIVFGRGQIIKHPSVVRMKHHVRWIPRRVKFSRTGIFKRDANICQYCMLEFPKSKLTWDHVYPESRGGSTDWRNMVTACFPCNNKKRNRTPEEAGMPLHRKPFVPVLNITSDYAILKPRHETWKAYIPNLD